MTFTTTLKLALENAKQSDLFREGYGRRADHHLQSPTTAFWPVLAKFSGLSGTTMDIVCDDGTLHTGVVNFGDSFGTNGVLIFDRANRKVYPLVAMLPVTVSADGGGQGDYDTTCDLTYTATWNGLTLVSGASPVHARVPNCKMLSGTHGWGHMSGTTFVLDVVDEVPETALVSGITDWRVDATSGEIQKKVTPMRVLSVGAESDWTKIDDTQESDYVPCS